MKKRIFRSICLASFVTLFLAATALFGILYMDNEDDVKNELIDETLYISEAIENIRSQHISYEKYLNSVGNQGKNRITLVSSDGTVIYDNFAPPENMGNHLARPEISSAIENGTGSSTRLSATLGEKTFYYAVRLDGDDILRVACTTRSALGIMGGSVIWLMLISVFVLIIAISIARLLTKSIVNPINRLDLNSPLSNETYDELSPLLGRLEKQSAEIAEQMQRLSAQQREFTYITENMDEGLVIFGSSGIVLSANNSAKRILGNQSARTYLELYRDTDYIKTVESALAGKSSTRIMEKEQSVYQLSASPAGGKDKSTWAVLFIVDITEKEQAEKMRREFSANVSHELKTPLTSILGYAEIIENGIAKAEDVKNFAGRIHSEAAHLLSLIEDIIKLSRLDESDLKPEFKDTDLSQICRDIVGELSKKAEAHGVSLTFEGNAAVIKGYRPILYEMVFNLCDNAIIYNRARGSVDITAYEDGGDIILSVQDTGIGIPSEHQNRVFERFYRIDKSHSKQTGGTGLGLSIVKHGAMLHNAKIKLDSQTAAGTTVKIIFPKD